MATSKLQKYTKQFLSIYFGQYEILENTRPDWLITPDGERLELDFLIEELNIAIEVQGKQHYIHVPHFQPEYRDFENRIRWDRFKRKRCDQLGIKLIEISSELDAEQMILAITAQIPEDQFKIDPTNPNITYLARKKIKKGDTKVLLRLRKRYNKLLARDNLHPNNRKKITEKLARVEEEIHSQNLHKIHNYL